MKKTQILLSAFALILLNVTNTVSANFVDQANVPEWSTQAIHTLNHLKVISGNPDGTIRPNTTINRAEFCKIMVQATKTPLISPETASFPDVNKADWFYAYIETAKAKGWVKGYPDGDFRPGQTINRAEIAKILTQAFRIETRQLNASEWYYKYFFALNEQNLLAHASTFEALIPDQNPTRAEVFEQIYRAMKQENYFEEENIPSIAQSFGSTFAENPSSSNTTSQTNNTTAPTFVDSSPLVSTSAARAGALSITKLPGKTKTRTSPDNQTHLTALALNIEAKDGPVTISKLQVRRIGNGSYSDFDSLWVDINGKQSSQKISPNDDVIIIPLTTPHTISSGSTETFSIKTIPSLNAKKETSSRFTLFLPEWIEANTTEKNGFFPFGGVDIEIK